MGSLGGQQVGSVEHQLPNIGVSEQPYSPVTDFDVGDAGPEPLVAAISSDEASVGTQLGEVAITWCGDRAGRDDLDLDHALRGWAAGDEEVANAIGNYAY